MMVWESEWILVAAAALGVVDIAAHEDVFKKNVCMEKYHIQDKKSKIIKWWEKSISEMDV